ncbi:MAG: cytochrome c oxidase assembly factor Coa1 family protein [Flavobacterium nitrogenifigens]|uniref:cytochrome c oxidase assembly factor Coa1 family protein n=1 Tax=Flavobacterium nitrogenifigens TaxID=1617283 RepID=UPI0028069397|nr:cytochrome c oxidase assembly factor Coa1 family protein [Flavobacterium nitrogenifigens]MDQ8010905.1 cytochrome c oxidase assembly factor Coa1 family protein [Flavobacterium nitrogenifigens]
MDREELIIEKNWFSKNWIWLLLGVLSTIFILIVALNSNSKNGLSDTITAFKENSLYQKAIDHANKNPEVIQTIGKISPVDKLAILEGNSSYSNNNKSVDLSIRVNGDIKNGKLEIHADRNGSDWNYIKIFIRTKNPHKEIIVINKP